MSRKAFRQTLEDYKRDRPVGDKSYKSDTRSKQTQEQYAARKELVDDPGADDLDAFICSVQAAWGWRRRDKNYGAPSDIDRLEGWIVDPSLNR